MTSISPKFEAGDLLQSGRYKDYHLFVESVSATHYHVHHLFVFENEIAITYSKNAGHDAHMKFREIEIGQPDWYGAYSKVGKIPALIGQKYIRINK